MAPSAGSKSGRIVTPGSLSVLGSKGTRRAARRHLHADGELELALLGLLQLAHPGGQPRVAAVGLELVFHRADRSGDARKLRRRALACLQARRRERSACCHACASGRVRAGARIARTCA